MSHVVRSAAAGDRDAIAQVHLAAFADEGPAIVAVLQALRESGAVRDELVVEQAADGGPVTVGHVALCRGWVDAERALVEVDVLSPLGVHPSTQGRGIGGALVAAALDASRARGVPAVFLEGDPAYYSRRGFVAARELGFDRPSERIPWAAFQVVVLEAHEPWMTGRLVYPEAHWRADTVGLRGEVLADVRRRLGD
jgi:putative acetyltransferase